MSAAGAQRSRPRLVGRASPARSLAEQAYEAIKSRILSLEYRPGQGLNETAICESLGIGRTPVHQAVHQLASEGLIEILPRKGLVVRPDSLNEIVSVLEARAVVEPWVAGIAAERITPENVQRLRTLVDESREFLDQSRRTRYMELDRAFHQLIAGAADNPLIADFMRTLHERAIRIWHLRVWAADGLARTQHEHEAVLEAILRRDRSAAEVAMRRHIDGLRERILLGSR